MARAAWKGQRAVVCVLVAMVSLLSAACGTSTVSLIGTPEPVSHAVYAVAVTPDDALSVAIGTELAKRGYRVASAQQTTELLTASKAGALELMTPEVFAALAQGGIDAVVAVDGVPAITGHLQKATVTVTSTRTSQVIAAVKWRNAWGGMPGSAADAIMRKSVSSAAEEIVQALSNQMPLTK